MLSCELFATQDDYATRVGNFESLSLRPMLLCDASGQLQIPLSALCYINEAREVLNNARIVGEDGDIECPILLFSSNGEDQEKDWVLNQQKFTSNMGAKLISYDCSHYIHHFKSDEMSKEIIDFAKALANRNEI